MTAAQTDLDVGDFTAAVNLYSGGNARRYYGEALADLAAADPRIVCLGADLSASTETDLFRDRFHDRYFPAGIAEANMVGLAAGMARSGDIPFLHSFCVFSTRRCYDQIAMQVAYPRTNVKIVGFMPGLTTLLGVSHQAIDDVALMRALPNMAIIEPGLPSEIRPAVKAALDHQGPVYLRMRRIEQPPSVDNGTEDFVLGKARLLRNGSDCAILAAGDMVEIALQAAAALSSQGIAVAVASVASAKPFDAPFAIELARHCGAVVTAENHSVIGGLGSAVAETLMEAGIAVPFRRIGVMDTFAEGGSTPYLFDRYGLSADAVMRAVLEATAAKR